MVAIVMHDFPKTVGFEKQTRENSPFVGEEGRGYLHQSMQSKAFKRFQRKATIDACGETISHSVGTARVIDTFIFT